MSQFAPDFVPAAVPQANVLRGDIEITRLVRRVFDTPEGEKLLALLKSKTLDRKVEPFWPVESHDDMLRYLYGRGLREGQNMIVQQLWFELHEREVEK